MSARRRPIAAQARNREFFAQSRSAFVARRSSRLERPRRSFLRATSRNAQGGLWLGQAPQSRRRFRCAPVKSIGAPAQIISPRHIAERTRAVARRGQAPQSRPAFIARRSSRLERLRRSFLRATSWNAQCCRLARPSAAIAPPHSLRAGQVYWSACAGHFSAPHRGTLNAVVWLGQAPQSRSAFVARRSSRLERLRRSFP